MIEDIYDAAEFAQKNVIQAVREGDGNFGAGRLQARPEALFASGWGAGAAWSPFTAPTRPVAHDDPQR